MTAVKEKPSRYAAPALEKGLDLLEALAEAPGGLGQRELAERVNRSVGEVFRMTRCAGTARIHRAGTGQRAVWADAETVRAGAPA